jgi:DNA repair exonuclease SbcCD ATPase subunit
MTQEELKNQLENEFKTLLTKASEVVKKYIDTQDDNLKQNLEQEILEKVSDIDGISEKLEKLQALAQAFAKVFDSDNDGNVTAEEIAAKLALLQANIDKVAKDLADTDGKYQNITDTLNKSLNDLQAKVDANTVNISKNTQDIATIKSDLSNNFFNKEQIADAFQFDIDDITNSVSNVFFAQNDNSDTGNDSDNGDNQGDGATV